MCWECYKDKRVMEGWEKERGGHERRKKRKEERREEKKVKASPSEEEQIRRKRGEEAEDHLVSLGRVRLGAGRACL